MPVATKESQLKSAEWLLVITRIALNSALSRLDWQPVDILPQTGKQ